MFSWIAQTVPALPVDDYGDGLLGWIRDAAELVLPYAAALTAFAIGVRMVKRWLGHRSAISLGGGKSYDWADDEGDYSDWPTCVDCGVSVHPRSSYAYAGECPNCDGGL